MYLYTKGMRKQILYIFLGVSALSGKLTSAQETAIYQAPLSTYNRALELFDKEKYGAAQQAFKQVMNSYENTNMEIIAEAEYYHALCALKLYHKDSEALFKEFIQNHPSSPLVKKCYLQLGNYQYSRKKWNQALAWYDKVDAYSIGSPELEEYQFKKSYALFSEDEYEKASKGFYTVKNHYSKYQAPALYYYGHIAYQEGKYETALQSFNQLSQNPQFGKITPYYKTQIFYYQEKYDSLISYASTMLEDEDVKRRGEISKLLGEAYYHKGEYAEAIPYLELYQKETKSRDRNEWFKLAKAYYETEDYPNSITYFSRISDEKDSLAQVAYYNLADCYLKLDNLKAARSAFEQAASYSFNTEIEEKATLDLAKTSYELGFDPYNKTADAFISYLQKYPDSYKKQEAYDYLINIYLNMNNYSSAIASMQGLGELDIPLQEVYQKMMYNLAVEQFQNKQYLNSISSFEDVRKYDINKELYSLSYYWSAEANYRMRQYTASIELYKKFIFQPRAILVSEFNQSYYNIAYAHFKLKEYDDAATWFRKYLSAEKDHSSNMYADALVRAGDCYFVQKDFLLCEQWYEKAVETPSNQTDYALFQLAQANGILQKPERQKGFLHQLGVDYPNSGYTAGAEYQLGQIALNEDKPEEAILHYSHVVKTYPESPYARRSLLSTGLVYYNQGQLDQALTSFKDFVQEYPSFGDSREAIQGIENIYKEQGNIEAYEQYLATLDFMQISNAALDSLTFESAELQYQTANYEQAITGFERYLERFNPSIFKEKATFMLADAYQVTNQPDSAVVYWQEIIDNKYTLYVEQATIEASGTYFRNGAYQKAINAYKELYKVATHARNKEVALLGQMRAYNKLDQHIQAGTIASSLLEFDDLTLGDSIEIYDVLATKYILNQEYDSAQYYFEGLVQLTQSELSGKALYQLALIEYNKNELSKAEEKVYKLVQHQPAYQYWIAKGLILLSDIYVDMDDTFQAKATLESILDNYQGDDELLLEAESKYNAILERENQANEPVEQEEIIIDVDNGIDEEIEEEEELEIEEFEILEDDDQK